MISRRVENVEYYIVMHMPVNLIEGKFNVCNVNIYKIIRFESLRKRVQNFSNILVSELKWKFQDSFINKKINMPR